MEWITEPERKTPVMANVDLLVCGGGFAGVPAADEIMGQLRLIPVCSATGQAAGTAAALALKQKKAPQNLEVSKLQKILEDQGMNLGLKRVKQ